jgi:phosphate transport system protein
METADLSHHISRRYNDDLDRLRTRVLAMGGFVEQQLQKAVMALVEGDSALGEAVALDDYKVNDMEVSIDEECSRLLAIRAPTAGDLRVILSIIKAITDLERIGDEGERSATSLRAWLRWSDRRTSTARSNISGAWSRKWCMTRSMRSRAWMPKRPSRWRVGIVSWTRSTRRFNASASRS